MDSKYRAKNAVPRTWQALGGRLLRELQFELRDEFLNGEIFYSIKEVRVLTERWRLHYPIIRPHSVLGYRPPAQQTWQHQLKTGYKEAQSKMRFPPHLTLDGNFLMSPVAARTYHSSRYKQSGRATCCPSMSELWAPW